MLVRAASDKRLGTVLVELGVIDERKLVEVLGAQLGLPPADLGRVTPEPDAVALLSESLARGLVAVSLRIASGTTQSGRRPGTIGHLFGNAGSGPGTRFG